MKEMFLKEWEILLRKPPLREKLTAKHIMNDLSGKLYCAIDSRTRRHLMIKLDKEEKGLEDSRSRGVSAHTREIVIDDMKSNKYIDIECQDTDGYEAFDLLISEVKEFINENMPPYIAASRVLTKWRRFWSKVPKWLMSREAQIGLFAELKFLSEWVVPKLGTGATNFWRGPFGGRNDFKLETFSIEVKATTSTQGRVHHINGLDQLSYAKGRKLFFFSMCMREEVYGLENLVEIVKSIRDILSRDLKALDHFEEGLVHAGYSDIHADEYRNLCLSIEEQNLFEVRGNFPRIDSKAWEILHGVERVEYEINLNTFDSLIIAREPAAWTL